MSWFPFPKRSGFCHLTRGAHGQGALWDDHTTGVASLRAFHELPTGAWRLHCVPDRGGKQAGPPTYKGCELGPRTLPPIRTVVLVERPKPLMRGPSASYYQDKAEMDSSYILHLGHSIPGKPSPCSHPKALQKKGRLLTDTLAEK